jgi:peptidoglycan/LPS O-acetylase OafA/YrhL
VNGRALQLDGLRAISMMAICWDHWLPETWPRIFPFEIFLFFFLVLTGYLITASLLRERDRGDAGGKPWRMRAMKTYQIKRGLRILAPYYAALAFAIVVGAPDVLPGLGWYVFHLSNIHIAMLGEWPGGTSHFWSLAMQQQFYLFWPLVIWFVPKRLLVLVLCLFTAVSPVARVFHDGMEAWLPWPQALTFFAFDYFGIGGLLALAVHRGMSLASPVLRWIGVAGFLGWLAIYSSHRLGWETFGLRPVQQTLLSLGMCGVIGGAVTGFRGTAGKLLENAFLQRVGQVSYGIYLFHNLAPLATGKILPWLFTESWAMTIPGSLLRIAAFAAVTWLLTLASWRWIETPLMGVRAKMTGVPPAPTTAGADDLKKHGTK